MTDPELLPMRVAERLGRLYEWAMQQTISDKQRVVLMHLIRCGDDELCSFWSHEKIAEAIGSSARSVGDAVRKLEAAGLIRRQVRKRHDKTRGTDRTWVLAPPSLTVFRQNQRELAAAAHEGDLTAVYGLSNGSANIAAPMESRSANIAEHNFPIPIDREVPESSARQILPRRRSRVERIDSDPRRVRVVIEELAA